MYSNYIHDDYHQAASAEIELSLNDFADRIKISGGLDQSKTSARERDNIACTNTASARSPREVFGPSTAARLVEKGKAPKKKTTRLRKPMTARNDDNFQIRGE